MLGCLKGIFFFLTMFVFLEENKKSLRSYCNWKKNPEGKLLPDLIKIMQVWGAF